MRNPLVIDLFCEFVLHLLGWVVALTYMPFKGQKIAEYRAGPTYRTHPDEYCAWSQMRTRCHNRKTKDWSRYGGRGITICKRWLGSFAAFVQDMGKRPSAEYSLDRYPNGDGNYEPGNCRWANAHEQAGNTCRNRHITFAGRTQLLSEWAMELGITRSSLSERLHNYPDPEVALAIGKVKLRTRNERGRYIKAIGN